MSGARIAHLLDLWQLTADGEPLETASSWIQFTTLHGGGSAVLKIPKPGSDEGHGAKVLQHYRGSSAVRVLDRHGDAYLMERAEPGTTLESLVREGRDDEATEVIANTIGNLHQGSPPTGNWTTVETLALGFTRYRRRPRPDLLAPTMVDRAEGLFRDLCGSQSEPYLLHGDLHHANMLEDRRGWLAIDPKGVLGEVAYETASMLHNPIPLFELAAETDTMRRRVAILAQCLSLSPDRILQWCFAKGVLGHIWTIEDGMDTRDFPRSLRIAETAASLLQLN